MLMMMTIMMVVISDFYYITSHTRERNAIAFYGSIYFPVAGAQEKKWESDKSSFFSFIYVGCCCSSYQ